MPTTLRDVDAILARFPGPVTLRPSRLKWFAVLAVALGLVAFAVFVLGHTPTNLFAQIWGWSALVFAGGGALVVIAVLLPGSAGLTLSANGFAVTKFFRTVHMPWPVTDGFTVAEIRFGPFGQPQRLVAYEHANKAGAVADLNRRIMGRNAGLPDTYGLSHDDLAWLMTQWRERALARSSRRP
jgi:hypothetical protein